MLSKCVCGDCRKGSETLCTESYGAGEGFCVMILQLKETHATVN